MGRRAPSPVRGPCRGHHSLGCLDAQIHHPITTTTITKSLVWLHMQVFHSVAGLQRAAPLSAAASCARGTWQRGREHSERWRPRTSAAVAGKSRHSATPSGLQIVMPTGVVRDSVPLEEGSECCRPNKGHFGESSWAHMAAPVRMRSKMSSVSASRKLAVVAKSLAKPTMPGCKTNNGFSFWCSEIGSCCHQ